MPSQNHQTHHGTAPGADRRVQAPDGGRANVPPPSWPRCKFRKARFTNGRRSMAFAAGISHPEDPRARIRVAPGPSPSTSSGRYMRGEGLGRPRSGGRQKLLSPEEEAHFAGNLNLAWLVAQRAKAMGDRAYCAAIFKAATGRTLTETNFQTLWEVAVKDPGFDWGAFEHECMAQQSDEELLARNIHGCIYHPPTKYPRPPMHKRPAQSWIDHFLAVSELPRDEQAELKWSGEPLPSFEPFSACHASVNMTLNPLGLIPSQQG